MDRELAEALKKIDGRLQRIERAIRNLATDQAVRGGGRGGAARKPKAKLSVPKHL